jgi:aryl-alcohol dehydrogenase-like predicted oxidoreductase
MLALDQRKLGASEITVPAMGVGLWSWGSKNIWGYGKSFTGEDINQAYRACLEAGLNFFDTAEAYGNGESERLLGQCRRQAGQPILIATKYAPVPMRSAPKDLRRSLDASLERLGVETVDLYQIHFPAVFGNLDALLDTMAEAVQAGKIRAVGVSNFSAALLRHAHTRLAQHGIPLASNQVRYSLLYRYPEVNGVLEVCRELNVALIAYSPLEQGILSGKFRHSTTKPAFARQIARFADRFDIMRDRRGVPATFRQGFLGIRDLRSEKLEPLFIVMERIAQAHDKTIAQVALNWLLTKDDCIIPIPGAKNYRQAHENAGAIGWRLTPEEHAEISQAEEACL